MSGISLGRSYPRPCSGRKTFRRCSNNEGIDDIIMIDVDSDQFDNVIIIDVPEPSSRTRRGSSVHRKDKKCSLRNVIYIDDDEVPDDNHSDIDARKSNFSAREYAAEAVTDEHHVEENATPVRLSKCRRTYSGKSPTRNHYGFDTDSENDSSDNDYHDPEVVVDSSGKVQEQWEKAFSKKRKDIRNGNSGVRDHDSTFPGTSRNHNTNVETTGASRAHKEAPLLSMTEKFNKEGHAPSHISMKGNSHARGSSFQSAKQGDHLNVEPRLSRNNDEILKHSTSSNSAHQEQSTEEMNHQKPASRDEKSSSVELFPPRSVSSVDKESCAAKVNSAEDGATMFKNQNPLETQVDLGGPSQMDNHENFQKATSKSFEESNNVDPEILMPSHVHDTEAKLGQDSSVSDGQLEDQNDNDDQLHSENRDAFAPVQSCIINDREKLKETDEYKRAIEEELASRKEALRIQAEEAQRERLLLKRSRAEKMRLLDMQRRQQQRLEDMRNAQKKDEEDMNMKEVIRATVRKELNKLETSCHSMAFLLHSLGISVGSWPTPSPQEVQTAYKRALLTFHPDRALRSDIRQQVEAEEKFKLINRLKEKLSPLTLK